MKKMTRILAMILVMCMLLMTGCSQESPEDTTRREKWKKTLEIIRLIAGLMMRKQRPAMTRCRLQTLQRGSVGQSPGI